MLACEHDKSKAPPIRVLHSLNANAQHVRHAAVKVLVLRGPPYGLLQDSVARP